MSLFVNAGFDISAHGFLLMKCYMGEGEFVFESYDSTIEPLCMNLTNLGSILVVRSVLCVIQMVA